MAEKETRKIDSISELIKEISPYYKKEEPIEHTLTYESYAETLEPIYYFVLDLMSDLGLETEKLIDNFSPSPGSTEFGEIGARATRMQVQSMEMLKSINAVLRSVLNILYDLKELKSRLETYDAFNSSDENTKNAAILGLKQIWLDKVDINKGNSAIKVMGTTQGGFATLINAFLAVKDVRDAVKIDLAEPVKRIITARIQEFNTWVKESQRELRSRYAVEKNYLRSQVNSLKLYSRWVKPYLFAAKELEQTASKNAALVKSFNRTIIQLTLLGKKELKVKEEAIAGELPYDFAKDSLLKKLKRNYYSCVLINFVFRAVPQRTQSQATYIGRVDINFKGYSLNEDELAKLKQEIERSDLEEVLRLIKGVTDNSLDELQKDIDFFLEEKEETKKEKKTSNGSNPFLALIGYYNKPKEEPKKTEEEKEIVVKKDTWIESTHLRNLTEKKAKETAFNLFNIYKKAHGMPNYDLE